MKIIRQINNNAAPSPACVLLKTTLAGLLEKLEPLDFLFEVLYKRDLWIYSQAFLGCLYHYQYYKQKRN